MRTLTITIAIFMFINTLSSQIAPNRYYIEFTDKDGCGYDLSQPEDFLSARALSRRERQGIRLNISDLPVSQCYLDSLQALGVKVLNTSKWFNAAIIQTENPDTLTYICRCDFVRNSACYRLFTDSSAGVAVPACYHDERNNDPPAAVEPYDYGESERQIDINNARSLHNEGYRGNGMLIAITDGGFNSLPDLPAFADIMDNDRIVATKNFVNADSNIYELSATHGTSVFSILGGNWPGNLIGSAPEATFALLVSEDINSELIAEEFYWVAAAEFADSLGADIINVSLGYFDFDDSTTNHSYADLDGQTTVVTKAANMAAQKGMIVAVAASNNGNDTAYPYISAPADAPNILTCGSVDCDRQYSSFSSIGPTADGRVKPDVAAMGEQTFYQNISGGLSTGNGTSFATPLIAGMTACLWQKYPQKNNLEIIEAIRQAANQHNNPDNRTGFGIPNFAVADNILDDNKPTKNDANNIAIFPNPTTDLFNIKCKNHVGDDIKITIYDVVSQAVMYQNRITATHANMTIPVDGLRHVAPAPYNVTIRINDIVYTKQIIKI